MIRRWASWALLGVVIIGGVDAERLEQLLAEAKAAER